MNTQNRAFILDERYKEFIFGKAARLRLYRSAQNYEKSLIPAMIYLITGVSVAIIFLFTLVSELRLYYIFRTSGIHMQAIVTDCQGETVYFRYEVNGQNYTGHTSYDTPCVGKWLVGDMISIQYLAFAPEQSQQSDFYSPELTCIIPILLAYSVAATWFGIREASYGMNTFRKFRRLRGSGIILDGEITKSLFTQFSYARGQVSEVPTIHYTFDSPTGVITHSVRRGYPFYDERVTLPKVGTKVYVLYADDDCHMML